MPKVKQRESIEFFEQFEAEGELKQANKALESLL